MGGVLLWEGLSNLLVDSVIGLLFIYGQLEYSLFDKEVCTSREGVFWLVDFTFD